MDNSCPALLAKSGLEAAKGLNFRVLTPEALWSKRCFLSGGYSRVRARLDSFTAKASGPSTVQGVLPRSHHLDLWLIDCTISDGLSRLTIWILVRLRSEPSVINTTQAGGKNDKHRGTKSQLRSAELTRRPHTLHRER